MSLLRRPAVALLLPPLLAAIAFVVYVLGDHQPRIQALAANDAAVRVDAERTDKILHEFKQVERGMRELEVASEYGAALQTLNRRRNALLRALLGEHRNGFRLDGIERTGRDTWRADFRVSDVTAFVDFVELEIEGAPQPDRVEVRRRAAAPDTYSIVVKL